MRRATVLSLALGLFACSSDGDVEPPVDPAVAQKNCELYAENCYACHGTEARGRGPHGMHLDPPPSDLLAPASRDLGPEALLALVRDGVPDTAMPAFADLISEADMRATLEHVDALAAGAAVTCNAIAGSESGVQSGTSGDGASDATSSATTNTTGEPDPETTGPAATSSGSDGGASSGSSGETTSADVSPQCEAWCSCLDASCSAVPGYPIGSTEECYGECATRTDEEITCWQNFCDSVASNPALADHNCEHAWGGLGLAEC